MQAITSKKAQEESTFVITVAFADENGDAMVPTSIAWSLVDAAGAIINSRQDISITPAASVDIVLSGDDLQILAAEASKSAVQRYIVIEAVYDSDAGSDLTLTEQISFVLENLKKIS